VAPFRQPNRLDKYLPRGCLEWERDEIAKEAAGERKIFQDKRSGKLRSSLLKFLPGNFPLRGSGRERRVDSAHESRRPSTKAWAASLTMRGTVAGELSKDSGAAARAASNSATSATMGNGKPATYALSKNGQNVELQGL